MHLGSARVYPMKVVPGLADIPQAHAINKKHMLPYVARDAASEVKVVASRVGST
jgi:hypothetical protein